jgi:hypothetical protein
VLGLAGYLTMSLAGWCLSKYGKSLSSHNKNDLMGFHNPKRQ